MGLTQDIGNKGEAFAAEYVKNRGYIISATNYRTKYGEIDIIAENNREILFIEVKTRAETSYAMPHEYVNYHKRRRLFITAEVYLKSNGYGLQPRFDIAEVFVSSSGKMRLNYIKNAFDADLFV